MKKTNLICIYSIYFIRLPGTRRPWCGDPYPFVGTLSVWVGFLGEEAPIGETIEAPIGETICV